MKTIVIIIVLVIASSANASEKARHLFDARDAIEMSRFSSFDEADERSQILISPDSKHFAFLTSRGLIGSDSIESRLWVYGTREVYRKLHAVSSGPLYPHLLATEAAVPQQFSYFSYSSIITQVQWAPDSSSLYFLSQSANGNRRLCRAFLDEANARLLTSDDQDVVKYVIRRQTVVYVTIPSKRQYQYIDTLNRPINKDVVTPDGVPLSKVLFPHQGYEPEITELWTWQQGRRRHVSRGSEERPEHVIDDPLDKALSLSPTGKYIVQLRTIKDVLDAWSAYEPAPSDRHLRIQPGRQTDDTLLGVGFLKQYVITDAESGKSEVLVSAPVGRYFGYFAKMETEWSADGAFLLLTNTFLPLEKTISNATGKPVYPCLAAVLNVSTRNITCLQHYSDSLGTASVTATRLEDARFVDGGIALALGGSDNSHATRFYRYVDDQWATAASAGISAKAPVFTEDADTSNLPFSVRVHQGLNDAPELEAINKATGQVVKLWNPNPQFKDMRWGEASVFHWKDRNGYQWSGGLIRPVDYIPGKRYPLVIQMYTFHDGEFLTDGMAPTAMPARAIASTGMFYLQASKKPGHTWDQQEAQVHLDGVLSAIDALDAQGLIDPRRVGIIGFSFTTWYVENELVKAPGRFAAATLAEGADNSYTQYLFWGISNAQLREQMEAINGGSPFGLGLERWIKNAPAFHLDQVQTPLRIEAMTPGSLIGEWELYSSLCLQHKPVDLIYYPEGQHQLQKPLERLASAQGNVDWFRFWLQDYEDPSKPQQYERWRRMRQMNHTSVLYSPDNDDVSK